MRIGGRNKSGEGEGERFEYRDKSRCVRRRRRRCRRCLFISRKSLDWMLYVEESLLGRRMTGAIDGAREFRARVCCGLRASTRENDRAILDI